MVTIVTHTQNTRPALLERCIASVATALPPGAKHTVIECFGDFAKARYEAMLLDDIVAFVDDDDYIAPESIRLCLNALEDSGAALAVTNEVRVDINGSVIDRSFQKKYYSDIMNHPRGAHHLCVMRTKYLDRRILDLCKEFPSNSCWLIKANIALLGGAIHVPMDGYFWTQHEGQATAMYPEIYSKKISTLATAIKKHWPRPNGCIPFYPLATT